MTKEEYLERINNSPIFDMVEADDPDQYIIERQKLMGLLFAYYQDCAHKEIDGFYLATTVCNCVKTYERTVGSFFVYFENAFRKTTIVETAKENIQERRGGVKISREQDRQIRLVVSVANSHNYDLDKDEDLSEISLILDWSYKKVVDIVTLNKQLSKVEDAVRLGEDDEDEWGGLIENIGSGESATSRLDIDDEYQETFDVFDEVYSQAQDRTKRKYATLLTCYAVHAADYDRDVVNRHIAWREFYDYDVAQRCLMRCERLSQKEIAFDFGVSEVAISKIAKQIREKYKELR